MTDVPAPAHGSAPPPTPPRKTHRVSVRLTDAQDAFARERETAGHITRSEYFCWLVDMDMVRVQLAAAEYAARMTPEQKEEQRRSFAYGNAKIANDRITREDVDRAAAALEAVKHGKRYIRR